MQKNYDIIIVGGGIVGLTLACALAQQTALRIAILDAQPLAAQSVAQKEYHHRVSAISLASSRIFKSLNVWDSMCEKRVSAFTKMQVWDAKKDVKIDFDSQCAGESALGFIIENTVMQSALITKVLQGKVELFAPTHLASYHVDEEKVTLTTDKESFSAALLVAADGAHSWLRQQASISLLQAEYQQEAIICTVQTALSHQKVARQVFLETGPLAFLPLKDPHLSSIVWTLPTEVAEQQLAADETDFKMTLAEAFSHRLGEIVSISKRYTFPLRRQEVKSYQNQRLALVGDAAHVVHPLAGQGLNMGLLDAAALSECIMLATQKQKDFSSATVLRRYERWRKADNMPLLFGIDAIKNIFATPQPWLSGLRTWGMHVTQHQEWIKQFFMTYAIGNRNDLPLLARRC